MTNAAERLEVRELRLAAVRYPAFMVNLELVARAAAHAPPAVAHDRLGPEHAKLSRLSLPRALRRPQTPTGAGVLLAVGARDGELAAYEAGAPRHLTPHGSSHYAGEEQADDYEADDRKEVDEPIEH